MCEPAPFAFGRRLSLQTTEEGDQRRVATLLDDFWQGEVSSLSEAVVEELAFELTLELDGQSDFHCSQCSLPDDCDQLGDRSRSHRPGRHRLDRSRMSPNPVALQPARNSRIGDHPIPSVQKLERTETPSQDVAEELAIDGVGLGHTTHHRPVRSLPARRRLEI